MTDLDAILRSIRSAPTREVLWERLLDYVHSKGVVMASYHSTGPDGKLAAIRTDGFPKEWVDRYLSEHFVEIDPIPDIASRMAEPFYWHDIEELARHTPEAEYYLDAFRAAGVGDGLAFYVFGPSLQNAYVGLGFGEGRLSLSQDTMFEMQCVVQAGHLRYCALAPETTKADALTARELEVLHWVSRGKSNSVIADILKISPHTVDAHIRSIYRKLGVADRTSAAVIGVGGGMIQPL
ncbi:MAG: LuxR family transcriptional regulator [Pseudomonadota bacterium]